MTYTFKAKSRKSLGCITPELVEHSFYKIIDNGKIIGTVLSGMVDSNRIHVVNVTSKLPDSRDKKRQLVKFHEKRHGVKNIVNRLYEDKLYAISADDYRFFNGMSNSSIEDTVFEITDCDDVTVFENKEFITRLDIVESRGVPHAKPKGLGKLLKDIKWEELNIKNYYQI